MKKIFTLENLIHYHKYGQNVEIGSKVLHTNRSKYPDEYIVKSMYPGDNKTSPGLLGVSILTNTGQLIKGIRIDQLRVVV
jgi:hypothetical protein